MYFYLKPFESFSFILNHISMKKILSYIVIYKFFSLFVIQNFSEAFNSSLTSKIATKSFDQNLLFASQVWKTFFDGFDLMIFLMNLLFDVRNHRMEGNYILDDGVWSLIFRKNFIKCLWNFQEVVDGGLAGGRSIVIRRNEIGQWCKSILQSIQEILNCLAAIVADFWIQTESFPNSRHSTRWTNFFSCSVLKRKIYFQFSYA